MTDFCADALGALVVAVVQIAVGAWVAALAHNALAELALAVDSKRCRPRWLMH